MPRLLLMPEVAELTRTPIDTLRYWRHVGDGPPSFKLGRRVMYRAEDVDRWIEEQATGDPAA
ncbi:MAG: helix-turn-helix domain-containing protein [Acidimicrobiales bacterium]